jgi:hypothetical protein
MFCRLDGWVRCAGVGTDAEEMALDMLRCAGECDLALVEAKGEV